jgi:hypothetical protein
VTVAVAAAMAGAATALLDELDDAGRAATLLPFPAEEERRRWFYTPTDHGGLPLAAMTARQQQATHRLLATGLSRAGYVTAATIMGLENVLDHTEGWTAGFGRERGRDPQLYSVTIFGDPGRDPWGWRFGGHHVSVHLTVVDGRVGAATPCFLGADPADSPLLGPHLLRPLAGVEDLARELVRSLDDGQRSRAVLSPAAPADLVGGNRSELNDGDRPRPLADVWRGRFDGALAVALDEMQRRAEAELGLTEDALEAVSFTRRPKGLPAVDLSADQQAILRAVTDCYLERLPDELADEQKAKVGAVFGSLHLAWAGGTERHQPHYYRIQGGDVLIEYDNTQRDANHIHSVWRDLSNDFGDDVLARHRARSHRH